MASISITRNLLLCLLAGLSILGCAQPSSISKPDASTSVDASMLLEAGHTVGAAPQYLSVNGTSVGVTPALQFPTCLTDAGNQAYGPVDGGYGLQCVSASGGGGGGSSGVHNWVYVSPSGSDTTGTGTPAAPYATIAHANSTITGNTASNVFTISLAAGTYSENVSLKPSVVIAGNDPNGVTTTVSGTVALDSSWSSIADFEIGTLAGVYVTGATTLNWATVTQAQGETVFSGVKFGGNVTFTGYGASIANVVKLVNVNAVPNTVAVTGGLLSSNNSSFTYLNLTSNSTLTAEWSSNSDFVEGAITVTAGTQIASAGLTGTGVGGSLTLSGANSSYATTSIGIPNTVTLTSGAPAPTLLNPIVTELYGTKSVVADYGATCNGTTNDHAAFVSALSACGTSFGTLLLPASTCVVTGTAMAVPANCTILGTGNSSILTTTSNNAIFTASSGNNYVSFLNFRATGNATGTGQALIVDGTLGTANTGTPLITISGVTCYNFGGDCFDLFSLNPSTSLWGPNLVGNVADNFAGSGTGVGFNLDVAEYTTLTGNIARNGGNGGGSTEIGVRIASGNIQWTGGSITNNGIGIKFDLTTVPSYTNYAHGSLNSTMINHNGTSITSTSGSVNPGFMFVADDIYLNDIYLIGTVGVKFVSCTIDTNDLVFQGSTNTEFLGCTWPEAYPNNLFPNYSSTTSSEYFDQSNLTLTGAPFGPHTNDVAPYPVTIYGQPALSTATTNRTGGNVVLTPGPGATTNGTPGSVISSLSALTGSGAMPYVGATYNGTGLYAFQKSASNPSRNFLLLGNSALTPSSGTYTMYRDDANNVTQIYSPDQLSLNATGSGTSITMVNGYVAFEGGASPTGYMVLASGGLQLFGATQSFGGGSGVFGITNATTIPTSTCSGGLCLYSDVGALEALASGFQFNYQTITPVITEVATASTSSASGAAGTTLELIPQAGQAATGSGHNGGNGGDLLIGGAVGGTSGSATAGIGGALDVISGFRIHPITVTSSYTVDTNSTTSDGDILVNCASACTVTLPAHNSTNPGRYLCAKDISGAASANNVTFARNGGTGNIDGVAASYILQMNYGRLCFYDSGTAWWLL